MRHAWRMTLIGMLIFAGRVHADDDPLKQAQALEGAIQKVLAKVEPSVVCVLVSRSDGYQRFARFQQHQSNGQPGSLGDFQFQKAFESSQFSLGMKDLARRLNLAALETVPDSYGSGIVIDSRGLVLTNYHVVKDATKVYVRPPGKAGSYANIFAADERSDLAVLRLLDPPAGLTALKREKEPAFRKGQFVLAVTHPYAAGFRDGSPSVSWGLLSNLRRRVPGEPNEIDRRRPRLHYYGVLLQTDFRLNLGCSGGALVDLQGNWIGITTSQAAVSGGDATNGFAMPIDPRINRIIDVLARGEEVEYGFLGIALSTQPTDKVTVASVAPGGPSENTLQPGDRILRINGQTITEPDDLFLNVSALLAGTTIEIEVQPRFGQNRKVQVALTKSYWPPAGPLIAAGRPAPARGLRVDYTSLLYQPPAGTLNHIPKGVLVREVIADSAAFKAGLKADRDIIIKVNNAEVNSPKEFYAAVQAARGPLELTLADPERKVRLP
jgi:S1-C subfamily serine protease